VLSVGAPIVYYLNVRLVSGWRSIWEMYNIGYITCSFIANFLDGQVIIVQSDDAPPDEAVDSHI